MTEPSQYFKGRTVQEQMNEVIGYVDVRSAEVAVDAIASDVAQVHQDMLDADADASAAAASAAAAAGTLANAVKKTGEASQSIAGDIAVVGDLSGGTVTVPTPVNNTDAASKKYVDDADALKLNITDVGTYAVLLTGNQANIQGNNTFNGDLAKKKTNFDPTYRPPSYVGLYPPLLKDANNNDVIRYRLDMASNSQTVGWQIYQSNNQGTRKAVVLGFRVNKTTGACSFVLVKTDGTEATLASWQDNDMKDA